MYYSLLLSIKSIEVKTKERGIWIPEPDYYFKDFSEKEKLILNL